ncbi:hypothetical protein EYC84_010990 [Monilinia fructicola]|uniref:Uncharacterized protein n=1 Tax=Monilinia fructicola TaxID=38448 RepID=A0A5M9JDH4_MONFR|nr:hypothetical protein EYC84_010990 [Monilinia fructicola]
MDGRRCTDSPFTVERTSPLDQSFISKLLNFSKVLSSSRAIESLLMVDRSRWKLCKFPIPRCFSCSKVGIKLSSLCCPSHAASRPKEKISRSIETQSCEDAQESIIRKS